MSTPEQRIQTVKVVWKSDDDKVRTFTTSVNASKEMVEELNKVMGDSTTVVDKTTLSLAEQTAAQKKMVTQAKKTVTQYDKMTTSLKQQIAMTKMSDSEQEVYAAQMRLGALATEEQREEIAKLVTQLQAQRTATNAGGTSMRNARGIMQNFGWQMQDTIVQLQMGTSAMVVLSQQGSQMAAAFGPTGAIVGAVIALAGVLGGTFISSLGDAGDEVESLSEKLEKLVEKYKLTKEEAAVLIQSEQSIIDSKEDQIKKVEEEINVNTQLVNELKTVISTRKSLGYATTENEKELDELNSKLTEGKARLSVLSREVGLSEAKINMFGKAINDNGEDLDRWSNYSVYGVGVGFEEAKEKLDDLNKSLSETNTKNLEKQFDEITSAFESEYKKLVRQTETTDEEYERRKSIIDEYVTHTGSVNQQASDAYTALEKWKTDQALAESEKRIKLMDKEIEATYKWRESQLTDVESSQQSYVASTEDPRIAEQERFNETMSILIKQREALWAGDYAGKMRINKLIETEEDRHVDAMIAANVAYANSAVSAVSSVATMVSSTVDLLTTGVSDVAEATEDMTNTQKAMYLIMQTVAAAQAVINGIQMGTTLAAAAATYDWTGASSINWIATGAAIGAAQAGAIMGTTIAGAFDKGGVIPAGQMGIVSEYGDELVGGTLVHNNTNSGLNVTGREDTAKLLSGANSDSGGNTTIHQNITVNGSGDSALIAAMQAAAKQGAEEGYAKVKKDFKQGRGIRADLKKSIGV